MHVIALFLSIGLWVIVSCTNDLPDEENQTPDSRESYSMNDSDQIIKLSMVLVKNQRSAASIQTVTDILQEHGLSVTGVGTASLSARSPSHIAINVLSIPENQISHFKAIEPGSTSGMPVSVPEWLSPYIKSISIEPPAVLFNQSQSEGESNGSKKENIK